jgi:fructokinase
MRIGIDLGGTKIEAIGMDSGGREVGRKRIPTPRDYRRTLAAITELVHGIEAEGGEHGTVGVGLPGTPSPDTGLIKNANSTWLNGRPFVADLEVSVGRPVRVANDANCFALSEAIDGAAAGAAVVFGVIVGTGTGGGVVVNGQVLTGPNAVAGEWGHNPLPWPEGDEWPGPRCYCGRSGCIESFLSGPGLERDYGRNVSADAVAALAEAGDAAAAGALERYESRMARALASIINVLDPDVIVLGGGLSNVPRLYENVPRLWAAHVFSAGATGESIRTRLLPAKHGDASGVRGAAWLWDAR